MMVKKHLRKSLSDALERLGQESTHFPVGLRSTNPQDNRHDTHKLVFRWELHLPCNLLFGAPLCKERSTTNYTAKLVDQ
jgi:hypothetical protein